MTLSLSNKYFIRNEPSQSSAQPRTRTLRFHSHFNLITRKRSLPFSQLSPPLPFKRHSCTTSKQSLQSNNKIYTSFFWPIPSPTFHPTTSPTRHKSAINYRREENRHCLHFSAASKCKTFPSDGPPSSQDLVTNQGCLTTTRLVGISRRLSVSHQTCKQFRDCV